MVSKRLQRIRKLTRRGRCRYRPRIAHGVTHRLLPLIIALGLIASGFGGPPAAQAQATSISISTVHGAFYLNPNNSGQLDLNNLTTPVFSQDFPVIDFNPPSSAQVGCSNNTGVNENNRPFTDVIPNPDGSCSTIVAQGNGQQAGVGALPSGLFAFQAIFTANLMVAAQGQVTFNFFSDDGWMLGAGPRQGGTEQPMHVSGPMVNALSATPSQRLAVVGSFNVPSSPSENQVTISFPAAGTYPIEVDYTECCGGPLALVLGTSFGNPIRPSTCLPITLTPAQQSLPVGLDPRDPSTGIATFTAVVTDCSTGNALEQAPVLFDVVAGPDFGHQGRDVTGDSPNGGLYAHYALRGVSPGTDTVLGEFVDKAGHVVTSPPVHVIFQPPSSRIYLTPLSQVCLAPCTANLVATVTDGFGNPRSGVDVFFSGDNGQFGLHGTTDSSGRTTFSTFAQQPTTHRVQASYNDESGTHTSELTYEYFTPASGPRSAIGLFTSTDPVNNTSRSCTATLVGGPIANVIVTAAHCVFGLTENNPTAPPHFFTAFGYAPQFVGDVNNCPDKCSFPFGVWVSSSPLVDYHWFSHLSDPSYDFAFLVLDNSPSGLGIWGFVNPLPVTFSPPYHQGWSSFGYPGTPSIRRCQSKGSAIVAATEPAQMAIPCDMGEGASGGPWINSVNGVKDGIGGVNSQSGGFHFVDVHNPEAGVAPGCSALDELSGNCIDMISGTYLGSGASRALDDAETGRPQVYPTLG